MRLATIKDGLSRHGWADWAGLAGCVALAIWMVAAAGNLSLLLLPPLLKELISGATFLTRKPAVRSATGIIPQVVAFGHAYMILVFSVLAATWRPEWVATTQNSQLFTIGAVLWTFGVISASMPLVFLRHSFSIVPAARVLVTSGPYGVARHPIYSAYLMMFGGVLLQHLSLPYAVVMAVWLTLMMIRIRYEEAVLADTFPEYHEYRARVGAFGPRLGHLVRALRPNPVAAR